LEGWWCLTLTTNTHGYKRRWLILNKPAAGSFAGGEAVKSSIFKRSVIIAGHKTSVNVEQEFWKSLKEIAAERNMTVGVLVGEIDAERNHSNLSSAIRLFVLGFYRDQIDLAKDRTRETLVKPIAVVR
jgi:predicted DNA-binding ribbon-helix-helix protein